jgi:ABC-type transport system substrate-binding protein
MQKRKRLWSCLALGLLLVLAVTQCGPTPAPAATQPSGAAEQPTSAPPPTAVPPTQVPATAVPPTEAVTPNVFVYAVDGAFPDLDPAVSYSGESVVTSNCYETLAFYNPPGSAELLSPKLATSWESNEDATEWTFHLREGVKFHNGDPMNAEAVKAAIENTMEIGAGAAYIWDPVQEIQVIDDYTVKFMLSYSAPLDLIASAGYGEDNTVLQQEIESGMADFTYGIPPDNAARLQANPDLVVHMIPSFQNLVGLMNTQKPPLDNKLVRQALSYSVPYDQFIQGVLQGRGVQSHGPVPAGMWGHSDSLFQYTYDLDKAKQLLTEAGYPDGGFDVLFTFATGDFDQQQLAELWKAELAKLNINLVVQPMTWEAQWDLGMSDPQKAQDVFTMYWWPDYISPYSFLYSMFHSEDEILFNLDYYRNPDYDAMIDEANALSGSDRPQAEELFIQAQEILIDDAVSLFFYDLAPIHPIRADIKGYVDNPAYPHVVFVYDLTREK